MPNTLPPSHAPNCCRCAFSQVEAKSLAFVLKKKRVKGPRSRLVSIAKAVLPLKPFSTASCDVVKEVTFVSKVGGLAQVFLAMYNGMAVAVRSDAVRCGRNTSGPAAASRRSFSPLAFAGASVYSKSKTGFVALALRMASDGSASAYPY